MTLIDKAEALLPCPFCGGEAELWNAHDNRPAWIACMGRCAVLISKEHATDAEAIAAWNRRAIPARGVGVVCTWPSCPHTAKGQCQPSTRILSALAPTDAAHVNETPKSEHDAGNMLTPAPDAYCWPCHYAGSCAKHPPAPDAAAQAEDSYPYDGPEQCERDLEDTAAQVREAALREAAAVVGKHKHHWEDAQRHILALIDKP